jgi:hypothetical protein
MAAGGPGEHLGVGHIVRPIGTEPHPRARIRSKSIASSGRWLSKGKYIMRAAHRDDGGKDASRRSRRSAGPCPLGPKRLGLRS